ncbi:MAG: class I SAM-dependent methyltransferase [Nitrospirota bacterium]
MTAGELDFLLGILRREKFAGKHLEIGTAAGGTLCRMMQAFAPADRPPFVVVDPMNYFSNQLDIVRQNLRTHHLSPESIDFRVQRSDDAFAAARRGGERFDFILVDGAHHIRYVVDDLRWTQLLHVGGVVCLHDYGVSHGIRLAGDRFMRKNPRYEKLGCVDSLLALRKTGQPTRAAEITLGDRLWARGLTPLLQAEESVKKWSKTLRRSLP